MFATLSTMRRLIETEGFHQTSSVLNSAVTIRVEARYLRNRTWGDVKFLELKRHHFEVQAYFLMLAKKMLANQEELYSNHPGAREYADRLDNLLMRAFRSSDNNGAGRGWPRTGARSGAQAI